MKFSIALSLVTTVYGAASASANDSFLRGFVAVAKSHCKEDGDCSDNEWCMKSSGNCSGKGTCAHYMGRCTMSLDYVCGCDGETYDNESCAQAQGKNVDYSGECTADDDEGDDECGSEKKCGHCKEHYCPDPDERKECKAEYCSLEELAMYFPGDIAVKQA